MNRVLVPQYQHQKPGQDVGEKQRVGRSGGVCFGVKGVINKGVEGKSSILLCDDLDSTLCDLTGEKAFGSEGEGQLLQLK